MRPAFASLLRSAADEVLALGQHPSDEHEIGDWLEHIHTALDEAVDAAFEDLDATDPKTMPEVRKRLLMVAAVTLAAIASIDKGVEGEHRSLGHRAHGAAGGGAHGDAAAGSRRAHVLTRVHDLRIRRWVNRLAQLLLILKGDTDLEFNRASGDCVCSICREDYYRHARDPLSPWQCLTVLCDGRRVKL